MWSRTKRYLAKKWLASLVLLPQELLVQQAQHAADVEAAALAHDLGAVGELLQLATPVALADGDPTAASRIRHRLPFERFRSLSPAKNEGRMLGVDRPGSNDGASGVMVEEKSEDEMSGGEEFINPS